MKRPGLIYRLMMGFVGLFERWLHLSCRAFIQLASAQFERPLSRRERRRQAVHRFMCRLCRVQEQHLHQIHDLSRRLGETAAEREEVRLSEEARQRIALAVHRAADEAGPDQPPA